ncbi:ABC transporter substrate-binding protein [Pilimelia terevasa]|uniref:ABC transporter substrate-binding protein n=1 Tax=Pilimelia terevasa TaxID=53372 RepID=UPI001662CA3B|nr:ABC transporter substrate-binding protein [Pilimelia terevasa]
MHAGAGLALAGTGLIGAAGCARQHSAPPRSADTPPRRGGRLRAAFIGGTADTANVLYAVMTAVGYVRARVVYDTVGELDDDGRPVWRLAESVEGDATGTRWTIRLRSGPAFPNNRPVTAADVLFSLRAYVEHKAPQSALLADVDFAASRAADPRTLAVVLRRPNAFFDLVLTQSLFVVPAGTTDFDRAAGSGPFTITSYQPGKPAVLAANRNYWGADSGGPYLDELELVPVLDATARVNALKAGQVDYAASVPLPAARAEAGNPALQVLTPPKSAWVDLGIAFHRAQAPFTDARVVEAMRYAVDRTAMVRTVTLGMGEPAQDRLGAHFPYYATDLPSRDHDPERAKSLLTAAGASGLSFPLRTSDYEYGMVEAALALAEQARAAGVTVRLDKVPAADYYRDPAGSRAPAQSLNNHPKPLPLEVLYYYGTGAVAGFTGLAGPAIDPLVQAVRGATTEEKRTTALGDIQHFLHDKGGDLIYARAPVVALADTRVHHVQARGYAAWPSFRDAFLA